MTTLAADPDDWLAQRRTWLRATLVPDAAGRCRAYVLTPDGTVYTRPDARWEDRDWATIDQYHGEPWRIVRTARGGETPRPRPRGAGAPHDHRRRT